MSPLARSSIASLALLVCALSTGPIIAQTPPVKTQAGWTKIKGNAIDIGIGSSGVVHVVDQGNQVWRWLSEPQKWRKLPGDFRRVDTDSHGNPWAVTTTGQLRVYTNSHWQLVDSNVADVGIGDTHVFITRKNDSLAQWDIKQQRFTDIAGNGRYIDVDYNGNPWVITSAGKVRYREKDRWIETSLQANDIGVGKDSLYISRQGFEVDPSGTRSISMGPNDVPWLVTNKGEIYIQGQVDDELPPKIQPIRSRAITTSINWIKVPGRGEIISIGADGTIGTIDNDSHAWLWDSAKSSRNKWHRLPGKIRKIAIAENNRAWGIDNDNTLRRFGRNLWRTLKHKAIEVAATEELVAFITPEDEPVLMNARKGNLKKLPAIKATKIAVARSGKVYVIDTQGQLHVLDNKTWTPLAAPVASDISIGPRGTIMLIGTDQSLYRQRPGKSDWVQLDGQYRSISMGPADKPWAISSQSTILASSFFEEDEPRDDEVVDTIDPKQPKGSAEPLPADRDPLKFQRVTGVATDVAIGSDGSVFALDPQGQVLRYSNKKQRFLEFPGHFKRIAISPAGNPWGVTVKGEVYQHDGDDWELIRNITAVDIAIGADGTVLVSDASERIHRYSGNRFQRLRGAEGQSSPRGTWIAVDNAGNPWSIRKTGQVYRCIDGVCSRIEGIRASQIGIGPENSVFVIDNKGVLQQYNDNSKLFDRLTTRAVALEVGPQGKPWITTKEQEIYASAFFARDESNDEAIARASKEVGTPTVPPTSIGTTPSITFNKNIKLETIPVTARGVTRPMEDLLISPTGRILAIDSAGNFVEFSESARAFNKIILAKTILQRAQMDANEVLWGFDSNDQVYRQLPNNRFEKVPGLPSTPNLQAPYLAVSADGSVFASGNDGRLYEYSEKKKRFERFKTQINGQARVHGVEPDGDPWVIDQTTFQLYAFENNRFVKKRDNTGFFNIGAGGDVYITEDFVGASNFPNSPVLKYNATNKSFDRTNVTTWGLQVEPNGRLWAGQEQGGDFIFQRAKE